MSPAVILGAALQQQQQQQEAMLQQQQQGEEQEPPACGFYSSFQLAGESIAHRIGTANMFLLRSCNGDLWIFVHAYLYSTDSCEPWSLRR
jgi:hypothetical protein